nr:hypothetical protein [Acidovorax sp. JG5]
MPDSRFVMHRREADDEWHEYVEDRVERRLAGTTVFNRLIEVDRHTWGSVDLRGNRLVYLDRDVPEPRREDQPVEMLLLGQDWTLPAFAAAVRMGPAQEDPMGHQREAAAA